MFVESIVNSVLQSITYILPAGTSHDCWLVDCGDIDNVIEQGWSVRGVLLTHAHFDHIYGLNKLMDLFPNALIYTNAEGKAGLMSPKWNFSRYHDEVDEFVLSKPENVRVLEEEGCIVLDDEFRVDVLFTPGHDPSCVSYHIGDCLFTGDSYIPGMKTITSFPKSVKEHAKSSEERIKELEISLECKVYSGHWIENK